MSQQSSKSIAFLLPENTTSGGALIVRHHAEHLCSLGYEVHVFFENLAEKGLSMWEKTSVYTGLLRDSVRDFVDQGKRVDLAIATYWSTCFSLTSIPANHRAYFVQSDERRFFPESESTLKSAVRDTYSWAGHFHYVTEAKWIQRMLKTEFSVDSSYAPNGIDLSVFSQKGPVYSDRESGRFRILIEGAGAVPYKKVAQAFQVTKELRKKYDKIEVWHVASDGYRESEWTAERVFSRVPVEKMPEIYRSCDMLLKLSSVEGFFGPPLEMMACGGVCVVSDVTGHEEYIVDGENALVVPGGDVTAAASAVSALIEDSSLREKLIEAGLKTANDFSWEKKQDAFVDFVAQTIQLAPLKSFPVLSGVGQSLRQLERLKYKTGVKAQIIQVLKVLSLRLRETLKKLIKPASQIAMESFEPLSPTNVRKEKGLKRAARKVLFVGQEEYFRSSWFDAISMGHEALAIRSGGAGIEKLEEKVRSSNIDAVVVFRPEWLKGSLAQVQKLRQEGVSFWGFSTEPLPQKSWIYLGHRDQVRRWNSLKEALSIPFDGVFHFDHASKGFLERNAPSLAWQFLPLPVSQDLFFPEKLDLKFDACFLGRSTPYREKFLAKVKERFDVVHVAHGLRDEQARELMCQSKVVINLHNENYPNFENRVVQALLCGREVLSQPLSGDGEALPGVSIFETPEELLKLLGKKSSNASELDEKMVKDMAEKFSIQKLIEKIQ